MALEANRYIVSGTDESKNRSREKSKVTKALITRCLSTLQLGGKNSGREKENRVIPNTMSY